MRTCTTVLMLLSCVCLYAQVSRSIISIKGVAHQLGTELQNNSQDNEFQRGIRFRVTVNPDDEITIEQTWLQSNGKTDQMVLIFHPRDILNVDKKYHKSTMGLAIECKKNAVANYWMDVEHFNSSVDIPCLKDDEKAIARIEKTILRLKELSMR